MINLYYEHDGKSTTSEELAFSSEWSANATAKKALAQLSPSQACSLPLSISALGVHYQQNTETPEIKLSRNQHKKWKNFWKWNWIYEDFTPSTFVFDAAVKWINFCLFIYWVIFVITMGFLYMIKTYFLTLIISTCTSYSQWQYEVCINPFILNYFCYNKKLHIVWLKWLSSKCLMIFHLWYK